MHKNSMTHNEKYSTVNKYIILCLVTILGMACVTLPLKQGECPEARGYDSVPRHTHPSYGHPLYLRGGVCISKRKLEMGLDAYES